MGRLGGDSRYCYPPDATVGSPAKCIAQHPPIATLFKYLFAVNHFVAILLNGMGRNRATVTEMIQIPIHFFGESIRIP